MDTMRTVLALFHVTVGLVLTGFVSPSIIITPVLPLYKASIFVCELYSFTLQLSHAASYCDGLNTTFGDKDVIRTHACKAQWISFLS